jgi:ribosomal protein L15
MPLYRRIPKLGFSSPIRRARKNIFHVVGLSDVLSWVKGVDSSESGVVMVDAYQIGRKGRKWNSRKYPAGVKVLGDCSDKVGVRITLRTTAVSSSVRDAVEAAGGNIEIVPPAL